MPRKLLRGMMGEAKRKRRGVDANGKLIFRQEVEDAYHEDVAKLMSAQVAPVITQDDIPANLNVFATMEAAWNDLVERWFHEGMPDKLKQDGKFIFYHGVQAAANLMMYCEGQDMFGAAADQVQGDCIAYEKEAEAVLAERKAEEWRTGEI
jgi:hypothetical protein